MQEVNPFDLMPKQSQEYVAKMADSLHIDRADVGRHRDQHLQ